MSSLVLKDALSTHVHPSRVHRCAKCVSIHLSPFGDVHLHTSKGCALSRAYKILGPLSLLPFILLWALMTAHPHLHRCTNIHYLAHTPKDISHQRCTHVHWWEHFMSQIIPYCILHITLHTPFNPHFLFHFILLCCIWYNVYEWYLI